MLAVKRVRGRHVKIHRSYSLEEASRCVEVHKNTVRRWLKSGLSAIDCRRPALIHGADLRAFLDAARRRYRQRCEAGQLYCLRCRAPRAPATGRLEYLPLTATSGNLKGRCGTCEARIYRRVARDRISHVKGDCHVAFPPAPLRIGDTDEPCLNDDFAARGQNHDDQLR